MSWSLTKVVGLVIIPLFIAAAILGSLQSINERTITPEGEEVNQQVNNYGRAVTIGNNAEDREAAAEQLKGAMILSQASAWNCAMIPVILDGNMRDNQNLNNAQGNNESDYYVFGRDSTPTGNNKLFMYLYRSKSVPSCTGASEINLPSVDVSLPSIGDVVNIVTLIDDYEDIAGFMTCQVKTSMEKQNGQDMEGVYGRIDLKFSKNVKLGKYSNSHNLWKINIKNDDDGCWVQDAKREIQHLWKGQDVSQYLPYPNVDIPSEKKVERDSQGIEALKEWYTKQGDTGSAVDDFGGENRDGNGLLANIGDPGNSLAGEVIIDAPLIIPDGSDVRGNNPKKIEQEDGYYLFCEDAEGFIQTNTIAPGFEQESTKQSTSTLFGTEVEGYTGESSVTYTYVVITENRKSCFDEVDPKIGGKNVYNWKGYPFHWYEEE